MPNKQLHRLFQAWTSRNPPFPLQCLRLFLIPLSLLYQMIQQVRVVLYQLGVFQKEKLGARVISVGNLTMGGSGKTPTVALIAEILLEKGLKPAILSRGYGNKRKTTSPVVVSDGDTLLAGSEVAGDEPYLLAKNLKGAVVIVGKDRVASGKEAMDRFSCEALILDDGYQHLRLERDVNLCLIDCDARTVFEDYCFPSGVLREPVSHLDRADAFLLTHWEDNLHNRQLAERLQEQFSKKVFRSRHTPLAWLDTGSGKEHGLREVEGKKVLVFCGIAKPRSFQNHLNTLNAHVVSLIPYPDHHNYSREDGIFLEDHGEGLGADLLATTEKDWVKLEGRYQFSRPLWVLKIKIEVLEDALFRDLF